MRAIIAGGGIGGLTTALCMHRTGWETVILERAAQFENIGAGIQISPNGFKVLTQLGVGSALEAVAFEPECQELRIGSSGRTVFSIPLRAAARTRWGAPYLHVHRADLVNTLADAVHERMPETVRFNAPVVAYEQSGTGIAAVLDNNERIEGDVLIGADGIHSAVRQQMAGADQPQFTGCVAWRATVPMERLGNNAPPPSACVWAGPGQHAVTYRLRGGTLANIVGVVEQDGWYTESWIEQGSREAALADFDGWHPVITTLLEQADTHYRWALFDRDPMLSWNAGRTTLLGDACHPMLPFMAQGSAMAIEDAWILARVLAANPDIESALQRYFVMRHQRTSKVQWQSRANLRIFHQRGGLKQLGVYGSMWLAGKMFPEYVHSRQDWIYGYDILNI
ncbi:MAG: monooxygenase [Gammaproteobacteria bacterium]|nr:monooxygenase [Gammaproteobacteria bacterium]